MLHVVGVVSRTGIAQVEIGGHTPEPGRYIFRGQFRTGLISAGLSSHSAVRTANSMAGLARWSLSGFGFCIVLR